MAKRTRTESTTVRVDLDGGAGTEVRLAYKGPGQLVCEVTLALETAGGQSCGSIQRSYPISSLSAIQQTRLSNILADIIAGSTPDFV